MKHFVLSATLAVSFAATSFTAEASTVNGVMDATGNRADSTQVQAGSTLNFSGSFLMGGTSGEYAGYTFSGLDSLIFGTGTVNNGQTITAGNGINTLTFTVTDTVVASINTNAGTTAPGWNLAGYLNVASTGPLVSSTASFSLAGTNVDGIGYSIFIQTPPENFTPEVPLPAGLPLLVGALGGLALVRRRKAKSDA
ncbi:VPLPA-CTERM sorting domain-containing protein [Tropicibacter sp. S64]|uniref:VPLPA-CTERM sorting domain-containing protein n=1 Tax=Tropicibacter sp. S64 TaxID=3415122 RepID=UPI003C7CAFE8